MQSTWGARIRASATTAAGGESHDDHIGGFAQGTDRVRRSRLRDQINRVLRRFPAMQDRQVREISLNQGVPDAGLAGQDFREARPRRLAWVQQRQGGRATHVGIDQHDPPTGARIGLGQFGSGERFSLAGAAHSKSGSPGGRPGSVPPRCRNARPRLARAALYASMTSGGASPFRTGDRAPRGSSAAGRR